MPRFRNLLSGLFILAAIATSLACSTRKPQETQAMKPSITYLHLLRNTPFFTELNTDQLRFVIQHSREWEVKTGTTIVGPQGGSNTAGYWILLDGGWELRIGGKAYSSGHSDPGKWFNQALLASQGAELVANDHSYVMHISEHNMDYMLARGFGFGKHIADGKNFYNSLTTPPLPTSATK